MFNSFTNRSMGKAVISGLIAFNSLSVQAALTSYSSHGVDLFYSSVSDVTWTKDGNLLGSMIANSGDTNGNGTKDVIEDILKASTNKSYGSTTGYYLDTSSFETNGRTNWWGANAFINYLNSISYGGVNNWVLPTIATEAFSYNSPTNGIIKGDEFAELFGGELNGRAFYQPLEGNAYVTPFDNAQLYAYWSGTEVATGSARAFDTSSGFQFSYLKSSLFYAWAVSPGQIAAVPEPESVMMLMAGLGLIGLTSLSRKANN